MKTTKTLLLLLILLSPLASCRDEPLEPQTISELPRVTESDGALCMGEDEYNFTLGEWRQETELIVVGTISTVESDELAFSPARSKTPHPDLSSCVPSRTELGVRVTLSDVETASGLPADEVTFTVPGHQMLSWESRPVVWREGNAYGFEPRGLTPRPDGSLDWTSPPAGLAPGLRVVVPLRRVDDGTLSTARGPLGAFVNGRTQFQHLDYLGTCVVLPDSINGHTESDFLDLVRNAADSTDPRNFVTPQKEYSHTVCTPVESGDPMQPDAGTMRDPDAR